MDAITITAATTTTTATIEDNGVAAAPLSKNAQKRLLKEQRKVEMKEIWKQQKKEKRKSKQARIQEEKRSRKNDDDDDGERTKAEKKHKVEDGEDNGPRLPAAEIKRLKAERWLQMMQQGQRIVIDLDFESYMNPKEINSLVIQVTHCYSYNKKANKPVNLTLTSLSGKVEAGLAHVGGYDKWLITKEPRHFSQVFDKNELVYLTADSTQVLREFDPSKVYIIGGLVDHNRHKGCTAQIAEKLGIQTASLPLGDYVKLQSRKVLAVNHVMEMMILYHETHSWLEAFSEVMPARKGMSVLTETDVNANEGSNEDSNEDSNTNTNTVEDNNDN